MKIAMLYAHNPGFVVWSTPIGIHRELVSRGHNVQFYNLLSGSNDWGYSEECLIKLIFDAQNGQFIPDVVLHMDFGIFDSSYFGKLPGTKWVLEAGDDPQMFNFNYRKAEKFDVILTPDIRCVEEYKKLNKTVLWWPQHADTGLFHPRYNIEEIFDCITTCGPRGKGLTDRIKELLGDSFNNERYFHGQEYAKRLCSGRIVFQCSKYKEITRRIFEGMACGKMVITDRIPESTGIKSIFEEDRDIVYYDTAEEAVEKIRYYLSHEKERKEIALNGLIKIHQGHSVIHRVDTLHKIIGV